MRLRQAAICAALAATGYTGLSLTPAYAVTPALTGLPSPACSTATAASNPLNQVDTAFQTTQDGHPFGVVATPDGQYTFVSLLTKNSATIEVLRNNGTLTPTPIRNISVRRKFSPLGEAITSDGQYLLVADGTSGALVISVPGAVTGARDPVVGTLSDNSVIPSSKSGAIEVTLSADDRYAFVTIEDSDRVDVFNLAQALASNFQTSGLVGSIPLGRLVVGMALSHDGQYLYVTSEIAAGDTTDQTGTLSVINVQHAETDPASSVVANVDAGCNPVRVIVSPDGSTLWVTARASDDLLAFSAAGLLGPDPQQALRSITRVGEAPVGLKWVNAPNGPRIIVCDSNRFGTSAPSDLEDVNPAGATTGQPEVIGHIAAGDFPREMALIPGTSTLLVTNFNSDQLEGVDTTTIP